MIQEGRIILEPGMDAGRDSCWMRLTFSNPGNLMEQGKEDASRLGGVDSEAALS